MISVVYQPYNDTDTSLYTPSQVFVPPAETTTQLLCFCLLSNMWKLQKKNSQNETETSFVVDCRKQRARKKTYK